MKTFAIEVQGHRGARGLAPENTLAGFEVAFDLGVTSIETDLHLTGDDIPVLFHDSTLNDGLCVQAPAPALVRTLTLEQMRTCRIREPRTTGHRPRTCPLATAFAIERGLDPCGIPTLAELFEFANAYAGPLGSRAGKTPAQQERGRRVIFDLELKRVPFQPETIGDAFDGSAPATLEIETVRAIRRAGFVERCRVRSFDHRSTHAIRQLEPSLPIGLLIHNTAPADLGMLLTNADLYCPDHHFVDAPIVRQVREAGRRIIPYTVNEEDAWARLIAWGVHGITTDHPDRLIAWLKARGFEAM